MNQSVSMKKSFQGTYSEDMYHWNESIPPILAIRGLLGRVVV